MSTTRRDVNSQILHLAAIFADDVNDPAENESFQRFIFPNERITRAASNLHQIHKTDEGENTYVQILKNGDYVRLDMVEPRQAFEDFFAWLRGIPGSRRDRIRLVGHNSHSFDIHVLVRKKITFAFSQLISL